MVEVAVVGEYETEGPMMENLAVQEGRKDREVRAIFVSGIDSNFLERSVKMGETVITSNLM